MQQSGSAQDVKAQAESAVGPPAEAPLAPYVPLMATDAVADAAAALLLDDVVPVQEENVVVVEAISSNAGWYPEQLGPLCLALAFAYCVDHRWSRRLDNDKPQDSATCMAFIQSLRTVCSISSRTQCSS